MQSLRRLLPAPSALYVFEAAGRLGSFTLAAQELGISQAAVSYAIKQLEARLGVALFVRRHRAVALTEIGEFYHHGVTGGLTQIRRATEQVLRRRSDDHVTLSASTAFAAHWMLPRLAEFHADLPDVDLRLQTTNKDVDLSLEGIALGIRRGGEDWPGYDRALIAREEILAVCNEALLGTIDGPLAPEDLLSMPLIHLEEPFRPRPRWVDWFRAANVPFRDAGEGLRINDYALAIQAAVEGEGIVLGWRHLVAGLLTRGALVQASPFRMRTEVGFYVVWSRMRTLNPKAVQARDWIVAQAGKGAGKEIC